jgi:MSHA biogenesis protein MshP
MTSIRRQRGFSLVSAVFLLVVLTAAGAFMVRISGVQRTTTSFALLGPKAYHAARSGIEWAVYSAINVPASCPVGVTTTNSFNLTEGGLVGFSVIVTCTSTVHTEAGVPGTVFDISSTAERGSFSDRDYVSRRVEARVTDAF